MMTRVFNNRVAWFESLCREFSAPVCHLACRAEQRVAPSPGPSSNTLAHLPAIFGATFRAQVFAGLCIAMLVACGRAEGGAPEVLGSLAVPMSARAHELGAKQAALGGMVADAMFEFARDRVPGVAAAFVNAGALGYDPQHYRDGVYPAGPVTRAQVDDLARFDNRIVVETLSGRELRGIFEQSLRKYPAPNTYFLQVGGALRLVFDPSRSAGHRVGELLIEGRAVQEDSHYVIATIDHLSDRNGGYLSLAKPATQDVGSLRHALTRHFASHSPVTDPGGQRVAIKSHLPPERSARRD